MMCASFVPSECWVICETNRSLARENGYDKLILVLGDILRNLKIQDLSRSATEALETKRISTGYSNKLLIVGHRTDLGDIDWSDLRQNGSQTLEIQFTSTASAPELTVPGLINLGHQVPYGTIQELCFCLSQATTEHFLSQNSLNSLFERYRAEAHKTMLDPLLPLAVLIDGFLVACPTDPKDWFKPGVQAAVDAESPINHSVTTQTYWAELANSKLPMERIGRILSTQVSPARGFFAVLMTARELGWGVGAPGSAEAATIYWRACEAVKAAWDMLTLKDEVPPDDTEMRRLIEAASLGFHVLAAGHL
jgi:hypothetical protein